MIEAVAAHLDAVAALAPVWGYPLIFAAMAVESSFIPFPSEAVMIPAGFLAARGELAGPPAAALAFAVAAGVAGSLAGAYLNYFLALKLGKPFLLKYGRWFFVKEEPLEKACETFNRYGAATTFVCRLVPVIRQLISIPAGISKMPLGRFTFFTGLGAGIWTAVLAVAGYLPGLSSAEMTYLELVRKGADAVSHHLPVAIGLAVVVAVAYAALSRLAARCGAKAGR